MCRAEGATLMPVLGTTEPWRHAVQPTAACKQQRVDAVMGFREPRGAVYVR